MRAEGAPERGSERTQVRERPRAGRNARIARSVELEAYEVFQQQKDGDPMRHGGNVMAPDPELAMHYAREMFGRRNESTRLWVVRRADIGVLEDADLLDPPLDRSFKKPGGYVLRDKLAAARERAGTAKPAARAETHDRTGGHRSRGPA
jgi:ring-1,2-phenylacetyl-CoA epoxidase subunit PaaB